MYNETFDSEQKETINSKMANIVSAKLLCKRLMLKKEKN